MVVKMWNYRDEELATEVSWVVVYMSALSQLATSMLARNGIIPLLIEKLHGSESIQMLIPVIINS